MLPSPTPHPRPTDRVSSPTTTAVCTHMYTHTLLLVLHRCNTTVAALLGAHMTHLIILLHCCMHVLLATNVHTAAVAPHCLSAVRAHARHGYHTRSCLRVPRLPRRTHNTLHTCLAAHTHDQHCTHASTHTYSPTQIVLLHPSIVYYSTGCLLYTSPSPRDRQKSRMPSSA